LTVIAARYRVSVSDLQGWNSLRDGDIHVGQVLRVPGMQVAKAAESAPASGLYRIRQGDNLAAIARQFGVSVEDLKAWNDLRGTSIRAGESLRVAPAAKPAPRVSKASLIPVASAAQTVPAAAPAGGQRYRIRRGDSLAGIAERFHVSVEQLKAWNRLRGSRITAGEDLHVSPPSGGAARPATNATSSARPAAASSPAAKTQRYRIRRGDTLDSIAKRFGVSVDDLKSWNRLRNSRIHEGNYLTIQTEVSEKENPQKLASAGGG
jgi:LysM repeat protein